MTNDLIPHPFSLPDGFSFGNEVEVLAVAVVVFVAIGLANEVAVAVVQIGVVRFRVEAKRPFAAHLVLDDADGIVAVNGFAHPVHSEGVGDLGAINGACCGLHVLDAGDLDHFGFGHADTGHVVQHLVAEADGLLVFQLESIWKGDGVQQLAIVEPDKVAAAVKAVEVNDCSGGFALAVGGGNIGFAAGKKAGQYQKQNHAHV